MTSPQPNGTAPQEVTNRSTGSLTVSLPLQEMIQSGVAVSQHQSIPKGAQDAENTTSIHVTLPLKKNLRPGPPLFRDMEKAEPPWFYQRVSFPRTLQLYAYRNGVPVIEDVRYKVYPEKENTCVLDPAYVPANQYLHTDLNVCITYVERARHSGILSLVPRAWQEMLDTQTLDTETIPIQRDANVIMARVASGQIVGFIAYETYDVTDIWINCNYVLPEFRGHGVDDVMFSALVHQARAKDCKGIYSGVSVRNATMIKAATRQGRSGRNVSFEYTL